MTADYTRQRETQQALALDMMVMWSATSLTFPLEYTHNKLIHAYRHEREGLEYCDDNEGDDDLL